MIDKEDELAGTGAPARLPFSRVMVTGGDGFVGSHLLPALDARLAPGARCVTASRHAPTGWHGEHVRFDLGDPASVCSAVDAVRPDAIIHLAAQASVATSSVAGLETWRTNLGGSIELAAATAALVPGGTFLFASSAEVYGASFNDGIVDERTPPRPMSSYARSKAAAEAMFLDLIGPVTRLVIARPANHSGRGQAPTFVLPSFANQIAAAEISNERQIRVGALDAKRDFLDVRDVVDAYLCLLEQASPAPAAQIVNIASGSVARIGDLLDELLALADAPLEIVVDPARLRPSEVPVAAVDSGLMRSLGWAPRRSTRAMLSDVLDDQRARLRDAQGR